MIYRINTAPSNVQNFLDLIAYLEKTDRSQISTTDAARTIGISDPSIYYNIRKWAQLGLIRIKKNDLKTVRKTDLFNEALPQMLRILSRVKNGELKESELASIDLEVDKSTAKRYDIHPKKLFVQQGEEEVSLYELSKMEESSDVSEEDHMDVIETYTPNRTSDNHKAEITYKDNILKIVINGIVISIHDDQEGSDESGTGV